MATATWVWVIVDMVRIQRFAAFQKLDHSFCALLSGFVMVWQMDLFMQPLATGFSAKALPQLSIATIPVQTRFQASPGPCVCTCCSWSIDNDPA